MSGCTQGILMNIMIKYLLTWILIIVVTALSALLLQYVNNWKTYGMFTELMVILVSFWIFFLPFLGFWYFKKEYGILNSSILRLIVILFIFIGILIWIIYGFFVIKTIKIFLAYEAAKVVGSVSIEKSLEEFIWGVMWYFFTPLIFLLPLGVSLLKETDMWRKVYSYISAFAAILFSIIMIIYQYHFGRLIYPDYSPAITYVFLIQLLFLYFAGLAEIKYWVYITAMISVAFIGIVFMYDIFFAGFFYHGFALSLTFMLWLVIANRPVRCPVRLSASPRLPDCRKTEK